MSVTAGMVKDILGTTARVHRLDEETMLGDWWEKTALEAAQFSDIPAQMIVFLKAKLIARQGELAAARWYEQN